MAKGNAHANGSCFVVMGFGKKTDFETGRVLDLDKSYKNMIKPAVEAAGLKCIRADEIVHSGLIDVPMYEQLLKADVVVADLSTSNKNAFYELGIRHALRPFTTVVIAEDGIKAFPFDINHVVVRQYHHLGEDIGFEEVMRFREQLTKAITEIYTKNPRDKDSPVYTFLNNLTPPELAAVAQAKVQEAIDVVSDGKTVMVIGAEASAGAPAEPASHSIMMQKVDEAQKNRDWKTAKSHLQAMKEMTKDDVYILQRLALVTYKSKDPNEKDALKEACKLLELLQPATSNDTETLGLWGAVNKRLWELTKEPKCLDDSIMAYERGFYIRNDYYNGINYAYLLNIRAGQSADPAEAIADFIDARRVRKDVLAICEQWLKHNPMPAKEKIPADAMNDYLKNWYWVMASMGEAYAGLDEDGKAQKMLDEAYDKAPESWMKESTEEQLKKLKLLLDDSPLKHIKA
jgi:hypothetical protein